MNIEYIKQEIVEKLKPLNPNKIILFGSYAYGTPHKDSDIDIYIITGEDTMPKDFQENIDMKLKFFKALGGLTDLIATDIIVHTKQMNQKFINLNSYFSRKIFTDGEVLYAK